MDLTALGVRRAPRAVVLALIAAIAIVSVSRAALADPPVKDIPATTVAAPALPENPPPLDEPQKRNGPWSRADIVATIEREAKRAGIPAEIAEAVAHTESGLNPSRIGADGEIGLMQVLPSTARMMGFSGSLADLAVPDTNIRYGVTYLAQAYRLAGGDLCTAAMKYRAGQRRDALFISLGRLLPEGEGAVGRAGIRCRRHFASSDVRLVLACGIWRALPGQMPCWVHRQCQHRRAQQQAQPDRLSCQRR